MRYGYSVPLPVPIGLSFMPTVTPILRTQKRDKRGRCPIWIRLSDKDGDRYLSLGVKVQPSQWNASKACVRKSHPNSAQINLLIQRRESEAEEEILRIRLSDKTPTVRQVKQQLVKDDAGDFFAFAHSHLEDLQAREKIARYRRLKATLGKLEDFAGSNLSFEQITPEFLNAFETHCLGQGNKQSTAATKLSDLRALYNRAERFGHTEGLSNPFRRFKIKQGTQPDRTKLSLDEIRRLEALELPNGSFESVVRDFFLMSFYSGGIRFSDAVQMTQARIIVGPEGEADRLVYRAGKTEKRRSVKITPPARRILEKYIDENKPADAFIFPLLDEYDLSTARRLYNARSSVNTRVNKCLKELGKRAGIVEAGGNPKPISTHIARHSFADMARTSNWSTYDISKALQHSSLAITERYLKDFDDTSLDASMENLFGVGP